MPVQSAPASTPARHHPASGPIAAAPAASPRTVDAWLAAVLAGADHRALLRGSREACRALPPSTWIHLVDDAGFDDQLADLDTLLAACPDRTTLLQRHPLFGIPFAVKDNIAIDGVPTTAACPAFSHVPGASASVVARLRQAGAVWLGKTNLDQFATGLVGTRSPYGQPASVFSAAHVSGGSSSGSAVAVAAGAVVFSLGTDTAGSGRVTAGFNQIVGLKPTPGRVGTTGVLPACRSLDCVSIFALTVDDAAHVLSVIEGPDEHDSYSCFAPAPAGSIDKLRIGIPREAVVGSAYAAPWERALVQARALGHALVPLDFSPLHETAELLYSGPWVAERHVVVESLLRQQPGSVDPVVRRVIEHALDFSATDAFRAQYRLQDLKQHNAAIWQQVDLLLVPTAPNHPSFAEVEADPVGANSLLGTYTNFVNLLGWCALALPAGQTGAGLPFGVTLIGPANQDAMLAACGSRWQAAVALPPGGLPEPTPAGPEPAQAVPMRPIATEPGLPITVVGAHLSGMPLNRQLTDRGARLLQATATAPRYRLFALPSTTPPKPGLMRCAVGEPGHAIAVEVWEMPMSQVGSFLALIPQPLGLGSVELDDGRWVHGFICEGHALLGATEVSRFGGWRAYVASLDAAPAAGATDSTLSSP